MSGEGALSPLLALLFVYVEVSVCPILETTPFIACRVRFLQDSLSVLLGICQKQATKSVAVGRLHCKVMAVFSRERFFVRWDPEVNPSITLYENAQ